MPSIDNSRSAAERTHSWALGLSLGIALCSFCPGVAAGDLQDTCRELATSLRKHEDVGAPLAVLRDHASPHAVRVALVTQIQSENPGEVAGALLAYAVEFETTEMRRTGTRCSDSASLLAECVRFLTGVGDTPLGRRVVSDMGRLFGDRVLDMVRPQIDDLLNRAPNPGWLLPLYASLLSCSEPRVVQLIEAARKARSLPDVILDAILARHGNREAEGRILLKATSVKESCWAEVDNIEYALGYAGTDRIRSFLAENLRAEESIALTGGASVAKRSLYAAALVHASRADRSMPIPFPLGKCGDKELDVLEAWATKTLGIKYPDGPRKEIVEEISFEPPEENAKQLEGPAKAPRSERHDGK